MGDDRRFGDCCDNDFRDSLQSVSDTGATSKCYNKPGVWAARRIL